MSLSKNLRSRKSVDYKKLNEGEELPRILTTKHAVRTPATVLPDSYSVERIIDRKETTEGTQFLVKWANYHKQESTWEPAPHLPTELIAAYLTPDISGTRLQQAADVFENAVQQRLCSRQNRVVVNFDLDVYRYIFNSDKSVLISGPDDLSKLPMCVNWHYKLNKHGKGVQLSFPIRITPRLYNKRVFVRKYGETVSYSNPIERVIIKDKLSVGSLSPNLSKSFIKESPVSLSLYITNSFLKELYDAHKQTDLSYIDIINSQISEFQLKHVERLLTRFTQLSYRVNTSLSTKYKGGRKRAVFLSEQIKVAIYQNELVDVKSLSFTLTKFQSEKLALEKRCAMLLGEMKQLQSAQSDLEFENCTFQISENHLKKEICNLKTNTSFLQNENENMKSNIINQVDELALKCKQVNNLLLENSSLSEQNRKLQSKLSSAPKDSIVGFDETGSKNKCRLLNNFAEKSRNALWFAESFGLTPKAIKCESESGKNVQVNLEKEYSNIEHEDKRKLRELIFILDKFCISDAAYHELASAHIELPRKNHIVQERAELDSMFQIERCPGNIPGVYVSVTNEIASFIRNNGLLNDKPFKIKVAGDGTN